MTSVEVQEDVGQVESLQCVDGRRLVGRGSVRALGDVHVRDEVGQRVGLVDGDNADGRECLDGSGDAVNVALVVGSAVVRVGELSVGGSSGTVTVWKVVDDDLNELLSTRGSSGGEVGLQGVDLRNDIEPGEGGDLVREEHMSIMCI